MKKEAQARKQNPKRVYGYAHYGNYVNDPETPSPGDTMTAFDKVTHGVQDKKMIYLGGRPKSGKSMLLASLLPNIADQCPSGMKVRLITLEMKGEAYMKRMASIMAQVDSEDIDTGYASDSDLDRYYSALDYLGSLPIEYIESANLKSLSGMIDNPDEPTFFWALDNFGLISETSDNRDVVNAANTLQHLCQKVCTGMIIGHLNRASVGKRPTIESLAGSDQIGRNADEIWLLYKVLDGLEVDPELVEDGEPAEVVLVSRGGRGGAVSLWWDKHYGCFKEMSVDEKAEIVIPEKKGKK